MHSVEYEPANPGSESPQIHALDRAATGIQTAITSLNIINLLVYVMVGQSAGHVGGAEILSIYNLDEPQTFR